MKKRESSRITDGKMKRVYRMYKAKKHWLIAPVVIAALGAGLAMSPVTSIQAQAEDGITAADALTDAKKAAVEKIDKMAYLTDAEKTGYKAQINSATSETKVDEVLAKATEVNLDGAKTAAKAEINAAASSDVSVPAKNAALTAVTNAKTVDEVATALNTFRNATLTIVNAKDAAEKTVNALKNLSDDQKTAFVASINKNGVSTTEAIDKIVAEAKFEDFRAEALKEIADADYLTDSQKVGYTSLVGGAKTEAEINNFLEQVRANMPELQKAQVEAIAEINKLENLSDAEKAAKIKDVNNAATTDAVAKALEAAKTLDALNGAKADALKEIKDADYLTAAQKEKYTDAVNDAKDLEALNKILDEIRELAPVTAVAVYRAYNPNDGDHLYTTSEKEYKDVIAAGWSDEEIAWYSASKGDPVYRLYNPNSGEHFYTTSEKEYNEVAAAGWKKEDIAFYSDTEKAVAIYRVFNPNATGPGSHHFTKSDKERDELVDLGWGDEEIGFYGVEAPK